MKNTLSNFNQSNPSILMSILNRCLTSKEFGPILGDRESPGPQWRLGRARSRDSKGRDRPSRLKAVAGRGDGDGCGQC